MFESVINGPCSIAPYGRVPLLVETGSRGVGLGSPAWMWTRKGVGELPRDSSTTGHEGDAAVAPRHGPITHRTTHGTRHQLHVSKGGRQAQLRVVMPRWIHVSCPPVVCLHWEPLGGWGPAAPAAASCTSCAASSIDHADWELCEGMDSCVRLLSRFTL
jgi:hypothetical protein